MRGMRACATVNLAFLGLVAAAAAFSACAGGSTPPAPTPGSDAPPASAASTATAAPAPEPPKARTSPKTAADCKVLMSEITNDPPGGVAMNNAQTTKDAGATDRLELLTELIKSKRDGFRCCFDVWAKDHPGAAGSMKLKIKLKPDGAVMEVGFEDAPNRVNAPEVEACMSDLAKGLSYPRSPSGKETTFHYPFDFKARK
jgi:hypothetical protein